MSLSRIDEQEKNLHKLTNTLTFFHSIQEHDEAYFPCNISIVFAMDLGLSDSRALQEFPSQGTFSPVSAHYFTGFEQCVD